VLLLHRTVALDAFGLLGAFVCEPVGVPYATFEHRAGLRRADKLAHLRREVPGDRLAADELACDRRPRGVAHGARGGDALRRRERRMGEGHELVVEPASVRRRIGDALCHVADGTFALRERLPIALDEDAFGKREGRQRRGAAVPVPGAGGVLVGAVQGRPGSAVGVGQQRDEAFLAECVQADAQRGDVDRGPEPGEAVGLRGELELGVAAAASRVGQPGGEVAVLANRGADLVPGGARRHALEGLLGGARQRQLAAQSFQGRGLLAVLALAFGQVAVCLAGGAELLLQAQDVGFRRQQPIVDAQRIPFRLEALDANEDLAPFGVGIGTDAGRRLPLLWDVGIGAGDRAEGIADRPDFVQLGEQGNGAMEALQRRLAPGLGDQPLPLRRERVARVREGALQTSEAVGADRAQRRPDVGFRALQLANGLPERAGTAATTEQRLGIAAEARAQVAQPAHAGGGDEQCLREAALAAGELLAGAAQLGVVETEELLEELAVDGADAPGEDARVERAAGLVEQAALLALLAFEAQDGAAVGDDRAADARIVVVQETVRRRARDAEQEVAQGVERGGLAGGVVGEGDGQHARLGGEVEPAPGEVPVADEIERGDLHSPGSRSSRPASR